MRIIIICLWWLDSGQNGRRQMGKRLATFMSLSRMLKKTNKKARNSKEYHARRWLMTPLKTSVPRLESSIKGV